MKQRHADFFASIILPPDFLYHTGSPFIGKRDVRGPQPLISPSSEDRWYKNFLRTLLDAPQSLPSPSPDSSVAQPS